jgi:hypothetical protein
VKSGFPCTDKPAVPALPSALADTQGMGAGRLSYRGSLLRARRKIEAFEENIVCSRIGMDRRYMRIQFSSRMPEADAGLLL